MRDGLGRGYVTEDRGGGAVSGAVYRGDDDSDGQKEPF